MPPPIPGRVLREPAPSLNTLPQQWLAALLAFLQRPGQGRSDIVRRSAGLPYALNALFLAEPGNNHKVCGGLEQLFGGGGSIWDRWI